MLSSRRLGSCHFSVFGQPGLPGVTRPSRLATSLLPSGITVECKSRSRNHIQQLVEHPEYPKNCHPSCNIYHCRPFSTPPHHRDHHPAHTHTHMSPNRIPSHIASKLPDLSSVDPYSEEAGVTDGGYPLMTRYASCIPLVGLATQCACNLSSTPFSSPYQWRGEKGVHPRAHFWFVSFCDFPLFDHLLVPHGMHAEQKPCAAPTNCRADGRE